MKFGIVLPAGDARTAADFAQQAEKSGWDGFFVWEPVWGIDAWISLTAAAMVTQQIRLGTMLSPLSRMRPWKIASESATLDNLSHGRVILSVGLGAIDTGFEDFGEITERKTRAELVDESLSILTKLWSGKPFQHSGKHYQVSITENTFRPPPPPVQKPRIPIWVVGAWPSKKSMQRAMRYDGILPNIIKETGELSSEPIQPGQLAELTHFVSTNRASDSPFDIIIEGQTPGEDPGRAGEIIAAYQDAGATWWIETLWSEPDLERVLSRIKQGPPRGI
jgi:alkanesulfonate monooxygenase SsuD/methylene tetrahydromethanopterin reductase-like flavin-dependent oxidoreductase (luciferase family)